MSNFGQDQVYSASTEARSLFGMRYEHHRAKSEFLTQRVGSFVTKTLVVEVQSRCAQDKPSWE